MRVMIYIYIFYFVLNLEIIFFEYECGGEKERRGEEYCVFIEFCLYFCFFGNIFIIGCVFFYCNYLFKFVYLFIVFSNYE